MKYINIINENNTITKNDSINKISENNEVDIHEALITRFKLELKINKELYESNNISKELYEKVENILLDRIRPFVKHSEI